MLEFFCLGILILRDFIKNFMVMNKPKWKIGDKVYYFWHANDCSLVWNLCDFSIEEDEIIGFSLYGDPMITGRYDFKGHHAFYRTKQEAIDALIEHLKNEF